MLSVVCSLKQQKNKPDTAVHVVQSQKMKTVHVVSVWWLVFSCQTARLANSSEYYHVPAISRLDVAVLAFPRPPLCLSVYPPLVFLLSVTHRVSQ